jgi:hypothetical protein
MTSKIHFDMMTDAEINALDSDTFSDAIFDEFKESPAIMSLDEAEAADRAHREDADGIIRRAAFAFLTRSGAQLLEAVNDRNHALTFARCEQGLNEYRQKLEALAKLMRVAEMRLLVALATRDDMTAVMANAERDGATAH